MLLMVLSSLSSLLVWTRTQVLLRAAATLVWMAMAWSAASFECLSYAQNEKRSWKGTCHYQVQPIVQKGIDVMQAWAHEHEGEEKKLQSIYSQGFPAVRLFFLRLLRPNYFLFTSKLLLCTVCDTCVSNLKRFSPTYMESHPKAFAFAPQKLLGNARNVLLFVLGTTGWGLVWLASNTQRPTKASNTHGPPKAPQHVRNHHLPKDSHTL